MSWSKDQVKVLIDEYKKYPCLYATKSKQYCNKHARNEALNNIEKVVKIIRPDVTIIEIKNKFGAIRSNFMAENRKLENSKKSGAGSDEIYVPNIWYFESMKFVLEHATPKIAIYDSIEDTNIVNSETLGEQFDILLSQENALNSNATACDIATENYSTIFTTFSTSEDTSDPSTSCNIPANPSATTPSVKRNTFSGCAAAKRKQLGKEDGEHFLKLAAVALQTMSKKMSQESTTKEEDDIGFFLMYLGSKLRKIRDEKAYQTQK